MRSVLPETSAKDISFCVVNVLLPFNSKVVPGAMVHQRLELVNDGRKAWPADTELVLTSRSNELHVPESISLG